MMKVKLVILNFSELRHEKPNLSLYARSLVSLYHFYDFLILATKKPSVSLS